MAKITIKQHNITDCGAACLASISAHYNLQLPIAAIRQYAGTDKKDTNVLFFLIRIVKGLSLRITLFLRDAAILFFKNK
jgi:ABC-type bacteriocin/lantibiotic exporter with double-glycine peptidase domain